MEYLCAPPAGSLLTPEQSIDSALVLFECDFAGREEVAEPR